jgi:hypothetical protein
MYLTESKGGTLDREEWELMHGFQIAEDINIPDAVKILSNASAPRIEKRYIDRGARWYRSERSGTVSGWLVEQYTQRGGGNRGGDTSCELLLTTSGTLHHRGTLHHHSFDVVAPGTRVACYPSGHGVLSSVPLSTLMEIVRGR